MSIGELADAASLTRRTVRFYVQQKLLAAPHGVGRGKHYDASHLDQLRRIGQLQSAGHSLEEIRQILAGASVTPSGAAPAESVAGLVPARLRAQVWRRIQVVEGVELSFDASLHNPPVEELLALREAMIAVFEKNTRKDGDDDAG